jgi:YD repeat-containing protein
MRIIFVQIVLIAGIGAANPQSRESTSTTQQPVVTGDAVDYYYDARGRLIGTMTKIGGTMYLAGADGEPIGTFETVGDRRIFKPK